MCRTAHKVVQLYYSMFYQLCIHLFYSYVFILLSVFIELIKDHTKPEPATGHTALDLSTVDVQGRKLGHWQRNGSAYDDIRSGIRW